MNDIKTYYPVLEEVIKEKGLNNFWLMCGNAEFKPIIMTREKIIEKIKKRADQLKGLYRQSFVANIVMLFHPLSDLDDPDPNKVIFVIHIYVYEINEKGLFGVEKYDTVRLAIRYTKDELNENHLTIDELKEMIRTVYKGKILSDMKGISYTNWTHKYNEILKKEKLKKLKKEKLKKSKRSKN